MLIYLKSTFLNLDSILLGVSIFISVFLSSLIIKNSNANTSLKVMNQEKIFERFKGEIRSNLYEEIIAVKMQIKKIISLSILEILIGRFIGT